jgi:predicted  nucleic acid-binding Zn-ribbon protein
MVQLKKEKNYNAIKDLEPFFKQLNDRVESAFSNYQEAIAGKEKLEKKIASFDQEKLDSIRQEYLLRKKDRVERSKQINEHMSPYINVRNRISKHTRIQGLHAYKRLQETLHEVRLEEVRIEDDDQIHSIERFEIQWVQGVSTG